MEKMISKSELIKFLANQVEVNTSIAMHSRINGDNITADSRLERANVINTLIKQIQFNF